MVDLNECLIRNGECDYHTQCRNIIGATRECGECPIGFYGSGYTTCTCKLDFIFKLLINL